MNKYLTLALLLLTTCLSTGSVLGQAVTGPSGIAPPGDVLRPGHLGRQIGDIERIIHFYHDLLGTGIRGERNEARPFWTSPGLIEFAATPDYAEFRAVILPIPGTTPTAGEGQAMAVEAIEFRNMERHQYVQNLHDIGGSHLVLILRDLDAALAILKEAGVPVVTEGGEPVAVPLLYGTAMDKRAVVVRDPDGYPVELMQLDPAPPTTAPDDSNIIGARISLTVADLEATQKLYKDLMGPDVMMWQGPGFVRDDAYNRLRNTPGAEYRYGATIVPGSPVVLEFIQYRGIQQKTLTPILQDIGTGHILFMVGDMNKFTSRLAAAGMKTLAESGKPVFIAPTVHALFTTDPNNFFIEFMARTEE